MVPVKSNRRFFQLISLLRRSEDPIKGEKSSETTNIISSQAEHFLQNESVGLTEDFEALLEPGENINVNSSTLSQLVG